MDSILEMKGRMDDWMLKCTEMKQPETKRKKHRDVRWQRGHCHCWIHTVNVKNCLISSFASITLGYYGLLKWQKMLCEGNMKKLWKIIVVSSTGLVDHTLQKASKRSKVSWHELVGMFNSPAWGTDLTIRKIRKEAGRSWVFANQPALS